MTTDQITLIRNTWLYVITHSSEAGVSFYNHLFEIAPSVRPLFKEDIKSQAKKLTDTVTYVITKLDKMDTISNEINGLAKRHEKYGVLPQHFSIVNDALIYTLKSGLKEKWTSEVETAWKICLEELSSAMKMQIGKQ